jgi:hypothetical protein
MTAPIPITAAAAPRLEIIDSQKASERYEDAYQHARSIEQAGNIIRAGGWLLGIVIFCGAILAAHTAATVETPAADWLAPGSLAIGAVITVFFSWLIGILVSARGELLQASVDSAVNSSPFLSNAQRAMAMSLR